MIFKLQSRLESLVNNYLNIKIENKTPKMKLLEFCSLYLLGSSQYLYPGTSCVTWVKSIDCSDSQCLHLPLKAGRTYLRAIVGSESDNIQQIVITNNSNYNFQYNGNALNCIHTYSYFLSDLSIKIFRYFKNYIFTIIINRID